MSKATPGGAARGRPRAVPRAAALGWLLAAPWLLPAACAPAAPPAGGGDPAGGDPDDAIVETTRSGPVEATVRLWPREPVLGDVLTLTLTVQAEPGVTVEMPPFGDALGRFPIVDFAPSTSRDPDGATVSTQRYRLQAPTSGPLRIPPLRIEFTDQREETAAADQEEGALELLTEEIPVQVASVIPEGAVADELRPPRGSLRARGGWSGMVWLAVAAALLAAGGGALGARAWRRRLHAGPRRSAYEIAVERLARLEARGAPAEGEEDAWYVELSSVVRRYLEDRFGLRAPELTTQEFLAVARRSPELTADQRRQLGAFLEECDRVKFAAHRPRPEESLAALRAAREFLEETRQPAGDPGPPARGGRAAAGGAP